MIPTEKPGVSSHEIHSHDQKASIRKKQQERGVTAALLLHMEVLMTDLRPQSEGFSFLPGSPAACQRDGVPPAVVRWEAAVCPAARPREPVRQEQLAGRGRPDVCVLRRRGDLRGLRLQPRHRRKAAFGAGAERPDRTQKARPGQAGSDLCLAILRPNRTSRLPKRKLLDFRFSEVWRLKAFTSRSQKLMPE